MIIKKRPIITWLLNQEAPGFQKGLTFATPNNPSNYEILNYELKHLKDIREFKPDWGLPELVMPSFETAMKKQAPAFENMMPELFKEFSDTAECGILIRNTETLVYGFGDNQLNAWFFSEQNSHSIFHFYAGLKYTSDKTTLLIDSSILEDQNLFVGTIQNRIDEIGLRLRFIAIYLAVKKYAPVETITIPQGTFTAIDGTPLEYVEKKKVINQIGQKVIAMDSKWFRQIVNDNDIPVRGFFRMQRMKNEEGEWCKKIIFVNPYIRHGYHRNAKIEDTNSENSKKESKNFLRLNWDTVETL